MSRCASSARPTASAPSTATRTPAAAQSFAMRMPGCCPGCSSSASLSIAVLKSSAASTTAADSSTSAHHSAPGRRIPSAASAAARASSCTRRLRSERTPWASPWSAQPSRARKGRFLYSLMPPRRPLLVRVHVFEQDAGEHREPDVLVIQKRAETRRGLALADEPLLPQEQHAGGGEAPPVVASVVHVAPDQERAPSVIACITPIRSLSMSANSTALDFTPIF